LSRARRHVVVARARDDLHGGPAGPSAGGVVAVRLHGWRVARLRPRRGESGARRRLPARDGVGEAQRRAVGPRRGADPLARGRRAGVRPARATPWPPLRRGRARPALVRPRRRRLAAGRGPARARRGPRGDRRTAAASALRDRRTRDAAGITLVDGVRELSRALDGRARVDEVFVADASLSDDVRTVVERARAAGARMTPVSPSVLDRLAYGDRSEG